MKAQILLALLSGVIPQFGHAATFPQPFVLEFHQDNPGSAVWADLTKTQPPGTQIDDGKAPSEGNPSFLGHFKFHSTDDTKRTYYWEVGDHAITCDVAVTGDPKATTLIYHVDKRKFEKQDGGPDLNVVHVRCRLPGKPKPFSNIETLMDDPTYIPDDTSYKPEDDFDSLTELKAVNAPPLDDSDLEQILDVVFQISGQPHTSDELKDTPLNTDFWWNPLKDKTTSGQAVEYEEYQSRRAQITYKHLQKKAADLDSIGTKQKEDQYKWSGEVGRMVFTRSGGASKGVRWSAHFDTNHPSREKCYVNLSYDPHTAVLFVNMTASPPTLSLQGEWTEDLRGDKKGDPGAVTITCGPEKEDDGASINVAPDDE